MPSAPGWNFWVILLSAVVGTIAIASTRTIAKRRASIDLILISETEELKTKRAELHKLLGSQALMATFEPQKEEDYKNRRCVSRVLNHYELIAIAIFNRTVDEFIIKQYAYTELIKTWDGCEKLVDMINGSDKKLAYSNYRRLVRRWKRDTTIEPTSWLRFTSMLKELAPW